MFNAILSCCPPRRDRPLNHSRYISPQDHRASAHGPTAASGTLRILATTDIHMHMRGFDYFSDQPTANSGMTRLAPLIDAARREIEQAGGIALTFDNGDSLQGTPLDEHAMRDVSAPHVFYRALAAMRFDAAGLGNHDFNFDLAHLSDGLRNAPLPVLCSNIRRLDGQNMPVRQSLILDRHLNGTALKIGVFSVLPPQTLIWDADHLQGRVAIDDITQTARHAIASLRAEGCDIVIALAHTGLGEHQEISGQENALWPLSSGPGGSR